MSAGSTVPETMKRQIKLTSELNTFEKFEGAIGSQDFGGRLRLWSTKF